MANDTLHGKLQKPSFVNGTSKIADIESHLIKKYLKIYQNSKLDWDAITSDWEAVGSDFWAALEQFKEESHEEK